MSRPPKYAKKVDANQGDIVKALEKIGCSVCVIGEPVDLLCGYRGENYLIDAKNPETDYGKNDRSTDVQREFFASWRGQAAKAWTPEQAIAVVTKNEG